MSSSPGFSSVDADFVAIQQLGDFSRFNPLIEIEAEIERRRAPAHRKSLAADWLLARLHERRAEYPAAIALLVRLIRRAGLRRDVSISFRLDLVHLLTRMGKTERAERLLRRTLAKADFRRVGKKYHAFLLNELGRIYRRRGALTLASEVYQRCLEYYEPLERNWVLSITNLIIADLRADRLDRAHENLLLASKAAAHPDGRDCMFIVSMVWLSYWTELADPEECDRHLEALRGQMRDVEGVRFRALFENYQADVLQVKGRYREAAELYERVLAETERPQGHYDLSPSLARGLAESLMHLGEYERAQEHALFAVRSGATFDRMEHLWALRILGECRWAVGRHGEAREALLRAAALHDGLEFARERARLAATLDRLRIPFPLVGLAGPRVESRRSRPRPAQPSRILLRDGREFLSLDSQLMQAMQAAATSELPVLIEGETGTGKELVARLIHELGPRGQGPFVVPDCSTLPDNLVESELFGVLRGAYTGCSESRDGIVVRANGGTLFLDELPELSLTAQGKLLRLLQEGTYRRVGEQIPRRVDARFIAATNRPVEELLSTRALKPDLFHRLNGHRIQLRPLRERKQEIGPIARRVLEKMGLIGISESAARLLEQHDWPGNIRQLEMTLRVLGAGLCPGDILDESRLTRALPKLPELRSTSPLRLRRIDGEKHALLDVMRAHAGNVSAAARALGISRQALYKSVRRTGNAASL